FFMSHGGLGLRGREFKRDAKYFFEGQALDGKMVRERTSKSIKRGGVKASDILEMKNFLRFMGNQKIQITLNNCGRPLTSYILKSNNYKLEYIEVVPGMKDNITSQFYVDLNDLEINHPWQIPGFFYRGLIKPYYNFDQSPIKTIKRFFYQTRMLLATAYLGIEFILRKLHIYLKRIFLRK
ncbi:MAG: hypothetical protein ACFFDH_23030, partial [Promethearchaeota archaeon]